MQLEEEQDEQSSTFLTLIHQDAAAHRLILSSCQKWHLSAFIERPIRTENGRENIPWLWGEKKLKIQEYISQVLLLNSTEKLSKWGLQRDGGAGWRRHLFLWEHSVTHGWGL